MRVLEIQDENRKNPPQPAPAAQVQTEGEAVKHEEASPAEKNPKTEEINIQDQKVVKEQPILIQVQPIPVTPITDQTHGEPATH